MSISCGGKEVNLILLSHVELPCVTHLVFILSIDAHIQIWVDLLFMAALLLYAVIAQTQFF